MITISKQTYRRFLLASQGLGARAVGDTVEAHQQGAGLPSQRRDLARTPADQDGDTGREPALRFVRAQVDADLAAQPVRASECADEHLDGLAH